MKELGKNVADYAVMLAMAPNVAELPDDVDSLKAMVLAIAAEAAEREDIAAEKARLATENANLTQLNQVADERIATLTAIVNILERARFGTRSERLRMDVLTEEQHAIVFHEIETGVAALEAELERASKDKPSARRGRARASALIWSGSGRSLSLRVRAAARIWIIS